MTTGNQARFSGLFSENRRHCTPSWCGVGAFRVSQARRSLLVLGAVEHDDLVSAQDDSGVEGPCRLPSVALRREDGLIGKPVPGSKRQFSGFLRDQGWR